MRVEISNLTKHVCYITKPCQFHHNTLTAEKTNGYNWKRGIMQKKIKKIGHSVLHLANQGTKYEKIKNASYCKVNFFLEYRFVLNEAHLLCVFL